MYLQHPRYVVLYHEMPGNSTRGTHWDLMLENGPRLRTWALSSEPLGDAPIAGEQLPDHRVEYLDYEGPISGDRGFVTRWDRGRYEITREEAGQLELHLHGERLSGRALLRQVPHSESRWVLRFSPA